MKKSLTESIDISVKFNEADPLGIVWHGHYIRYFEDGREDFGIKHGLSYLDVFNQGFITPIISIQCDYKRPLKYGDRLIIKSTFFHCDAAKIKFTYNIFNAQTLEQVANGSSIQVFLNKNTMTLQLTNPLFFEEWKNKLDLI
ncbi:MAG: acyl-CoA thioesterase [Bacteroidetes bacterium]|nr:acyl-CoA thioesterase [Bacteroidota bacterium]